MRSVINISLPAESVRDVEAEVKKHKFASKSEFFRYLLREYKTSLLLRDIEKGRKEYREGKAKRLDNVEDFWQR